MSCGLLTPPAKFLAFLICVSLITVSVAPFASARAHQSSTDRQDQGLVTTPLPGAPEGAFPILDEVKNRQHPRPRAPQPNASTTRSRRNPRVPRNGRRIGDSLPLPSPTPSPSPRVAQRSSSLGVSSDAMALAGLIKPSRSSDWVYLPPISQGRELLSKLIAWNATAFLTVPLVLLSRLPDAAPADPVSLNSLALLLPQAGSAKISFVSTRDGNAEIYSMDADGSNVVRLTSNNYHDDNPRWSPDGTKILFQSDRDNPASGSYDIYVVNADGSAQTRLTFDSADDSAAVWSANGSQIAFQSLRNTLYYQVYVMNADGSNQINISNGVSADTQPSWSPDGSKIAFASDRDHAGRSSIYVMNANGSNQTRLTFTADPFADEQPAWSRDGSKLAFVSTRDSVIETWQETDDDGNILNRSRVHTNKEIYLMNVDGSNQVRLTSSLETDDAPYWSPDGARIIFRSDRERDCCDPTPQLWTMNTDGANQTIVSSNIYGDSSPSWIALGNQPPVANAGGAYTAMTGQVVQLNAAGSFDPDGSIVSYAWNFGDNTSGSGVSPAHTYASVGTYTVTLTVTDNSGAQASASTTATINARTMENFSANFSQSALLRQPYSNESNYWHDIFRAAYLNGQGSLLISTREFGRTLFESSEYAARNRSDHDYVYDLYKAYLMREPDQASWDAWTAAVPLYGREEVRRGFDESVEFQSLIGTMSTSGAPSSAVSSLSSALVNPFNQPGNGLASRDADWSATLLSLPGRAGLDLGLSISYSSMVWTPSGPYIYFDENAGSPSPGFRLGFPTIQEKSFDAEVGDNAYLLVTPGGRRVGLRQLGATNIYEAADSSYLQLNDYGNSLLVRSTDGTQMAYQFFNHAWHCTEARDRNGNYLTASYNWLGQIASVTDTLARTITFNYDANENLTSIAQSWTVNGVPQTHTWATFGWSTLTLQTSFSGAMAVGAPNGSTIPVLTQVGLDDGSRYNFEYTGAGQVSFIRRFTSDNVQRAYTAYDYQTTGGDCPRLSATRVWAENWTGINGVPAEVVTQYSDPGDGSHQLTAPDGTIYKEFYGGSGTSPVWQKGLPIQTEVWSGGVRQKWTTANWTQDNTGVSYRTNPRVIETNVSDASGNRRRATMNYTSVTLPSGSTCNLPSDTLEYAADATTILRRNHTDYVADGLYLSRHIVGLVSAQSLYEVGSGVETLMSKVGFQYDETGSIVGTDAPVQHDNINYASSFLVGRANLTNVKRYNVNDTSEFSVSSIKYNTAGGTVAQIDLLGHQNSVSYADSFSDGNNTRNTLAYPTSVTDADGFTSTIQYNFDFGGKTRAQGPPPAGQPQGLIQTLTYDSAARVEKVTTTNNSAYTRYIYGPNYVQSLSTVNTVTDEAYSVQMFDGAGRVTAAATNHPGSTGGYSAQDTIYDQMGRTVKQSNPTEISGSWLPAGDDAAGWLYTQQTYNWQGKPLTTTNTDGTTKEASYSGCGCAGGEVVTLTDEGTLVSGATKKRQQKIYSDVLGRTVKTEVLNWDGAGPYGTGGSVYSTVTNSYNARDQITRVRQYAGTDSSGVYQDTVMTYDGHGRLKTKHVPEQSTGTATTWDYNSDDTTQKVMDARGASATYGYNGRHQTTSIIYATPAGITSTPAVSFTYDAVGNRTTMTDGLGTVSYNYNTLSRLTSETRTFNNVGSFTLSYDYNLGGGLKSVSDPTNSTINYAHDPAGRLTAVTGSPYQGVTNYASNIQYRAWGGLKRFSFQNNSPHNVSLNYTTRMKVSHYEVNYTIALTSTHGVDYQYEADGRLRSSYELTDAQQDRAYTYDQVGRIQQVLSGAEARGEPNPNGDELPFKQNYGYDALGNLTSRTGQHWGHNTTPYAATYVNNRNTSSQWQYSADGDLVQQGNGQITRQYSYDAAGRQVSVTEPPRLAGRPGLTATEDYDGDGLRAKRTNNGVTSYELRSMVLGGRVNSDLNAQGQKVVTYIYADGRTLARQDSDRVTWVHEPPDGSGRWESYGGAVLGSLRTLELDPLGDDVGVENPYLMGGDGLGSYPRQGDPTDMTMGCMVNGQGMSCHTVMRFAVRIASAIEIHRAVGMRVPAIRSTWIGDDSRDSWDPNFETASGTYYYGDGGHFEVHQEQGGIQWLNLLSVTQFGPQNTVPIQNLRENVQKLLDNKDCADAAQKLLDTAAQMFPKWQGQNSKTFMEAFDRISSQGGYVAYMPPGATHYGGTVDGDAFASRDLGHGAKPAIVYLHPFRYYDSLNNSQAQQYYAYNALHETFHRAARQGYNDRDMAQVVSEITGWTMPPADSAVTRFSQFWGDYLAAHCRPK